ncbi:hypothetical protein ZIOFF_063788 [Zingiber officinale]|uniref:Uncharacterized protein n=1 Tax=Zingiber officinale TaxID=94328 RepID=A0A8J5F6Z4_ZINOF|nr:hypothetical protein ZIOFF_063788 [Zingiber officinale]
MNRMIKVKIGKYLSWPAVPDLGLDALVLGDERPRLDLHSDGGLGVEAELVARELRQDLRLPHRRVPDQPTLNT